MVSAPSELPLRYRPIRILGRGGQGTVYLVRDEHEGGAALALKLFLRAEGGREKGEEGASLPGEFELLSRLCHPALARVRDFGRLPGGAGLYFTSDYVAGLDLLEWGLA